MPMPVMETNDSLRLSAYIQIFNHNGRGKTDFGLSPIPFVITSHHVQGSIVSSSAS